MSDLEKTVLIVGHPGALALDTAKAFVCRKDTAVKMLVSTKDLRNSRWPLASMMGDSIELIEGSPEKVDFGFVGTEYLDLADRLTSIVCAIMPSSATARFGTDNIDLVGREIIEIARVSPRLEHVCVISNIDVAGNSKGHFAEHDLDVGQGFTFNSQEARFKVERVYRRFMGELPITVLRTGYIVGDGENTCPMVKLLLNSPGGSKRHTNRYRPYTHIDGLGEVIAELASSSLDPKYSTLHLISDCPLSHSELVEKVRGLARSLLPSSFDLMAGAKRSLAGVPGGWGVKEFFKAQDSPGVLESSFTRSLLRQRRFEVRALDDDALAELVDRAVEEIVGFK